MSKSNEQRDTLSLPNKKSAKSGAKVAAVTHHLDLLLLKEETAPKLGKFDGEVLQYQVTSDKERNETSIRIISNSGGGYFSREFVALNQMEPVLSKLAKSGSFPSKALADVFAGRSSNNAGFMAAILRHEGILGAAGETDTKHKVIGDFSAWKMALAALPGSELKVEVSESGIPLAPAKTKESGKATKPIKGTAT